MVHKFWEIDVTFPDGQVLKLNAQSKGHETAAQVEQHMKEQVYTKATSVTVRPVTGEVSLEGNPLYKGHAAHTPPPAASPGALQEPRRMTEPPAVLGSAAPKPATTLPKV